MLQIRPILENMPSAAYNALPFVLAPVIGNFVSMALRRVPQDTAPAQMPLAVATALQGMLPQLGKLAQVRH